MSAVAYLASYLSRAKFLSDNVILANLRRYIVTTLSLRFVLFLFGYRDLSKPPSIVLTQQVGRVVPGVLWNT